CSSVSEKSIALAGREAAHRAAFVVARRQDAVVCRMHHQELEMARVIGGRDLVAKARCTWAAFRRVRNGAAQAEERARIGAADQHDSAVVRSKLEDAELARHGIDLARAEQAPRLVFESNRHVSLRPRL